MIIVEGPDGSGKTTLIENLGHERKHLKALRAGVGSEGAGNWAGNDSAPLAYAKQIATNSKTTAFDRFYLSETIYGPLLRGASGITPEETVLVRRVLAARGVQTILCLPDFATTLANVTTPGRERPAYQSDRFLQRSYHAFASLYGGVDYDILYDFKRDLVPVLPIFTRAHADVIGSPFANILIVGDVSRTGLPFFSTEGSSGKLNRVLAKAEIAERGLALTTAYDADGRPRDVGAVAPPTTELVVFLGSLPTETRNSARGMRTASMSHPEQWSGPERDYVQAFRALRDAV